MSTPPTLPSSRAGIRNGSPGDSTGASPGRGPGFLALFLGAFAAVMLIAGVGAGIYLGSGLLHRFSSADKSPLHDTTAWQLGSEPTKQVNASEKPDIGWWATTYDLPKTDAVMAYLKNQGLNVGQVEPLHYQDTKESAVLTYRVHAEVPAQLMRLQQVPWTPKDPALARFAPLLVLNEGLPPGTCWDTQNAWVVAPAGAKLDFSWQVHWDKTSHTVTTDRLPFPDNVYTSQQVGQYQTETSHVLSTLGDQVQRINAQTASDLQANLARIPADPPKPKPLSSSWGGDGSGEPTKSAERIGGGTAAGAAGGAAFGAAAGDAGLGAGIGAGVGLLGGLIYDTVSKDNDKKKHERAVAAENANRLDEWRAQVKALNAQRAQVRQNASVEQERALADLASRITAAKGDIFQATGNLPAPKDNAPVPLPSDSSANQPSGPIRQP